MRVYNIKETEHREKSTFAIRQRENCSIMLTETSACSSQFSLHNIIMSLLLSVELKNIYTRRKIRNVKLIIINNNKYKRRNNNNNNNNRSPTSILI